MRPPQADSKVNGARIMDDNTLRIMCPTLTCRKILAVPAALRGKAVRCRSCGTAIRIPAKPPDAAPAPTAGSENRQGATP